MTIEELNRYLDQKIENALRPLRERVEKLEKSDILAFIDASDPPEQTKHTPVPQPNPVAKVDNSTLLATPTAFVFRGRHEKTRAKAAVVAKVLREHGPCNRSGLFAEMKKYGIFCDCNTPKTAYDHAQYLVDGKIAVNISKSRRARWAIPSTYNCDAAIAEAIAKLPDAMFEKYTHGPSYSSDAPQQITMPIDN